MSSRKYSILIPTRSRAAYLGHAITSALIAGRKSGCDFEVVVADNASEDETAEVMEGFRSTHVRWLRSEQRLSMRANFERALDASTGSHVCIIGDDDAVSVNGLAYLDALLDATDALVVQWPQMNYSWPPKSGGTIKIRFAEVTGLYEAVNTAQIIQRVRDANFFDYHVGGNVYHGFVSRSLIDQAVSKDGAPYFHAVVPDVYASFQNLFFAENRMVRAKFPISIGGASPRSNGADGVQPSNLKGSGEFARFVSEAASDKIGSFLPAGCRSVSLMELDAFLHVCRRHGFPDEINTQAWWSRVKRDIMGLAPADVGKHIQFARELLGDPHLGEEIVIPPENAATTNNVEKSPEAEAESRKFRLTSLRLAGGAHMQDISKAANFVDHLVAGQGAPSPTSSVASHSYRLCRTVLRAWSERV
ncbi:glycosyltransferase [Rhodobacter sp. CCP-1]|uniref:Glycosyltransferase n=1 Tax=Paragemmobacter ruber TaxID=1985673 RepID=A0ABW9Y3J9_9RHOB|nr:glycosyltransferase [Rhodobacter ruber]